MLPSGEMVDRLSAWACKHSADGYQQMALLVDLFGKQFCQ